MSTPGSVLIDLDSILDTRLGTLAKIDPELVEKNLNTDYLKRDRDCFTGINESAFKEAYAKRDVETLALSKITNIFKFLIPGIILPKLDATSPHNANKKCTLEVNVFPYQLDKEVIDEIQKAISVWLEDIVPVRMVHYDVPSLTPKHCKDNYTEIISYELEQWLNYHYNCDNWSSVEKMASSVVRIPQLPFITPALMRGEIFKPEEFPEELKQLGHPLKAFSFMTSMIVKLEFIDVECFSIIKPD